MISLSEEWTMTSKLAYDNGFIDDLASFMKSFGVKRLLECGCGDGNILKGLAKQGIECLGVDGDDEMIRLAKARNMHPLATYKRLNWLDINLIDKTYDCVMCRSNSLSYVNSWEANPESFDPDKARKNIELSIERFFSKLKIGGLLYLDTIPQKEINEKGAELEVLSSDIDLRAVIRHDLTKRIRIMEATGTVKKESFNGRFLSYLLPPAELEGIIKSFSPQKIWYQNLEHEKNYQIICAIK